MPDDDDRIAALEGELAAEREARARAEAELEQFAYRVSHDLHEPLRTITAFAGLIERRHAEALEGDAAEFLGFIVGGARRMQEMINGLLAYSRAGSLEPGDDPVDVAAAVDHALRGLRERVQETQAAVEVAPELPRVRGSEPALTDVFARLLSNALTFTREGAAPRVRVSAGETGGEWCFAVADEGVGLDAGQRERAFEAFSRLHARDDHDGAGMGLAISRRIVERHGGRIWAEANEPAGCVVRFTLPR